jgi:hypothetical protein
MPRANARARGLAVAGAIAVLALAAAGCGAQSHPNDPRPQVALRVSVSITTKAVTVQPRSIGLGPARSQQIPQNQNHAQPPIHTKAPVDVVFVAANQTRTDSRLEIRGAKDVSSGPLYANSSGNFQTELPTGTYVIGAADIPGARLGKLIVGPYRASSQNDVLLP